jgi:hypothetical protein
MIATILVEYRRAVAAARHYDHLRLHREPAIRRRVTSSRNSICAWMAVSNVPSPGRAGVVTMQTSTV